MKVTEEYKKAMRELFSALPHGAIKQISEEVGITPQKIYGVRDCLFRNDKVVETAKRIIVDHKKMMAKREDELVSFVEEQIHSQKLSA